MNVVNGFGSVNVTLGVTSIFKEPDFDVVKFGVESESLYQLNKLICDNLHFTDKHPEYKPHITLAYVKSGMGAKYVGDNTAELQAITFSKMVFTTPDGEPYVINL